MYRMILTFGKDEKNLKTINKYNMKTIFLDIIYIEFPNLY